jgi:hypothetical protein
MSQAPPTRTPPVVSLEEGERSWLESRIREYEELLDYLREH